MGEAAVSGICGGIASVGCGSCDMAEDAGFNVTYVGFAASVGCASSSGCAITLTLTSDNIS